MKRYGHKGGNVMAVRYYCRHCGTHVGNLDQKEMSYNRLGFNNLSLDERMEMLNFDNNGDLQVKVICEDCQEALERNPDYHSLHTFLH
jgi:hypothetical protein